jgi:hypothetical protein
VPIQDSNFFDVLIDAVHKRIDVREAFFAANELEELDGDLLPVEISGEIQDVGFEQRLQAITERRTNTDAYGGRTTVDASGVDAERREIEGIEAEVRRRKAEFSPTLLTVNHLPSRAPRRGMELAPALELLFVSYRDFHGPPPRTTHDFHYSAASLSDSRNRP